MGQAAKPNLTRVLAHLGFELVAVHRSERQHLINTLQRLSIRTVFDIGANQGQFGLLIRSLGYSGYILSLEPMNAAFGRLKAQARRDPLWHVCNVAIDSESREVTLNVAANSTSSSLLEISSLHIHAEETSRTVRSEVVRSKTLDEVDIEQKPAPPYFLKIDVQGNEMAVLDGGKLALDKTAALRIETSLRQLYQGAPTISAVLSRLEREGFVPIGFEHAFEDPRTGDDLQVDIIACRKELL